MTSNGFSEAFARLHFTGETTRRFSLDLAWPGAYLECRPAMLEVNPEYRDALLAVNSRVNRANAEPSEDEARRNDIELFADHVVVGWDGVPAEFSRNECAALLRTMPAWLFDRLRLFCKIPESFCEAPTRDAEELAKNS